MTRFFSTIRLFILLAVSMCMATPLFADDNGSDPANDKETDPKVLEKLEQWQDARFGLLMHWGTYSVKGWCESWPICSEDWVTRGMDNYEDFKKYYESLKTEFNPVDFNPDKWAELAQAAGMRYVVFTTKHHDGFCMFDTKTTDYKITDPGCPFSTNKRANITEEIFNAFRKRDFMIGAYFSKPDWHCDSYWSPYWATPNRHCNYNPGKYPELWQKFKDFTYTQIEELMRDYGRVDILWLDGSWVGPVTPLENAEHGGRLKNQDLDMDSLAALARSYQEGLIVVDRWVTGRHENYQTPEQKIPDEPLDGPWETCMPMAGAWSYYPDDNYKSTREILRQLTDIISRGGNYLLNIGVDSKGNLPDDAVNRLEELADWMEVNSPAIHNTRAVAPYQDGKCRLTQGKDGALYAIYVSDDGEDYPPTHILLTTQNPPEGSTVTMLGVKEPLHWTSVGNGILIDIPDKVVSHPPTKYAWVVKVAE